MDGRLIQCYQPWQVKFVDLPNVHLAPPTPPSETVPSRPGQHAFKRQAREREEEEERERANKRAVVYNAEEEDLDNEEKEYGGAVEVTRDIHGTFQQRQAAGSSTEADKPIYMSASEMRQIAPRDRSDCFIYQWAQELCGHSDE